MIRPVDAPLGQGFGENPTSKLPAGHWILKQFGNYQPDGHAGEDYPCPVGTPIRAVTSGKVLHVGFYGGTYRDNPYWIAPNFAGYCYVIDHGAFIGIYAHGQDKGARVKVGESVAEGQVIGLSGNTGGSTGPHLHFEALPDKFIVNSYMYGRINPATLFAGGLASMGTITPSEEDDPLAGYSREDLIQIAAEGVKSWAVNDKMFPDGRTFADHIIQHRAETGATKAAVDGLPKAIIVDYRVDGRNIPDNFKQVRTDIFGTRADGTVDVDALAAALAGRLEAADAEALMDALAKRLAE